MKLLVTEECGRLARWLRLMGHDTKQMATYPVSQVYLTAYNEQRRIITRNRKVRDGRLVRVLQLESTVLEDQLRQVAQGLGLAADETRWFRLCDRCNVEVEVIDKSAVQGRVPPYVYQTQDTFHICPSCQRIYWAATHWQRTRTLLKRITS